MRRIILLLVIVLSIPALGQVCENGLAGNWRMIGSGSTIVDFSPAQNHSVMVGQAAFATDFEMGPVVSIYGPTGAIVIPHQPALEPATGTIEVWVRFDTMANADIIAKTTNRLLRSGVNGGFSVYGLRVHNRGFAYAFVANDDVMPWTYAYANHGRQMAAGRWYHLAMRWDGSHLGVFRDGKLLKTTHYDPIPELGLSYFEGSPLYIAVPTWWSESGQQSFTGQVARVRVYSRALTDGEVETNYRAEAPASHRLSPH